MKHKLDIFQTGLRIIYEWLFSVLFSYFIIIIFMKKYPESFMELVLLGVYIVSYLVRRNVGYNLLIFLVHLILSGSMFLLPFNYNTKWVLTGIIIYQMCESFMYQKRGMYGNFKDVPWPTFVISIIIYAYGYVTKSDLLTVSSYIIPIILIIVYLFIVYIDGLKGYVESTKNVSGLPVNKIISVNSLLVFIIVLLLMAGMGIGVLFGLDNSMFKALKALLYVILYIILIIRFMFIILMSPLMKTSDEQLVEEQEKLNGFLSRHTDDVIGILDIIYKIGAGILIIYILYKAASWAIRILLRKRIIAGDKVEDSVGSKKNINTSHMKKERRNLFSSEQKFRRFYRERILMYRYDIRLDANKTSMDIKDELYNNELDDITEITKAYNDVRYGGKKATKEMIRLFDR